jgi:hypothetical protein
VFLALDQELARPLGLHDWDPYRDSRYEYKNDFFGGNTPPAHCCRRSAPLIVSCIGSPQGDTPLPPSGSLPNFARSARAACWSTGCRSTAGGGPRRRRAAAGRSRVPGPTRGAGLAVHPPSVRPTAPAGQGRAWPSPGGGENGRPRVE